MEKIVVASDSFKGSLTSKEVAEAIREAILTVKEANVIVYPIGDGGEGSKEALIAFDGKLETIECVNSLNEKIMASYGLLNDHSAVIEMSETAGLTLIDVESRNPLYTSTYGFGLMIKDAILKGCRKFIICIGGSGTNDCGIGLLSALGYRFLAEDDKEVSLNGLGIKDIRKIDFSKVMKELDECYFEVACDVNNPLCGLNGCSYVYAKQKGASETEIALMDQWIFNYSTLVKNKYGLGDKDYPGSGAAGGVGYCFKTFLKADLKRGIDLIINKIGIEKDIKDCDLLITGEGKLDAQSLAGKTPIGLARLAKKYHKKVIAFCGIASKEAYKTLEVLDAYYPISDEKADLKEAMKKENALHNLKKKVIEVFS